MFVPYFHGSINSTTIKIIRAYFFDKLIFYKKKKISLIFIKRKRFKNQTKIEKTILNNSYKIGKMCISRIICIARLIPFHETFKKRLLVQLFHRIWGNKNTNFQ